MTMLYNKKARKKPTNVSINSDLLSQAREHNMNLSQCLEKALENELRSQKEQLWQEENRDAIDEYNKRIEDSGTFSENLRAFYGATRF